MTNRDYALLAAKTLSDKKAQDVLIIDIQEKAAFADYFVICSAGSTTQVRAIADNIDEELAEKHSLEFLHKEGYREAEWVLLDYGDAVAHIFLQDSREYYALESLWGDAELTAYEGE